MITFVGKLYLVNYLVNHINQAFGSNYLAPIMIACNEQQWRAMNFITNDLNEVNEVIQSKRSNLTRMQIST